MLYICIGLLDSIKKSTDSYYEHSLVPWTKNSIWNLPCQCVACKEIYKTGDLWL